MNLDTVKLARQELVVDRWFDSSCQGIVDAATGFGKTFLTFLCIKRLEQIERSTYVIVVPSNPLEQQWKEKLKSLPKNVTDRIILKTVFTILADNLVYNVGTLIIDEIHEFTTDERQKVLDGSIIKSTRFLGLTASGDDKKFKIITKYYPVIDYISLEEARVKGFVADTIEYNLGLDLTLREKELYDNYTNVINKYMPRFQNNINLANMVLTGGKQSNGVYYSGPGWAMGLAVKGGWKQNLNRERENERLIDDMWNPNNFIGYAKSLVNAVRQRKTLLCTTVSKYQTTLELVTKFNKVKTILFSESTDFADKVAIILNKHKQPTVVYHSNLKTVQATSPITGKFIKMGSVRLKREALNSITTGKARILSTAKSLDRGLDIPDLRFSITTSGTQGTTQNTQRSGRAGRKEEGEAGQLPVLLVNLYMKDTQDQIWLNRRQENLNIKPIDVDNVGDISYTPPSNFEFTFNDL